MKRNKIVTLVLVVMHLAIGIFLSFDWDFLTGTYLGFGFTFLCVYLLSFPLLVSIIGIYNAIECYFQNEMQKRKLMRINGTVGILILICYALSWTGLISNSPMQNAVYCLIFIGTVLICICFAVMRKKKK